MDNDRPTGNDEQVRGHSSDWPAERGQTNQAERDRNAAADERPAGDDDQQVTRASDR